MHSGFCGSNLLLAQALFCYAAILYTCCTVPKTCAEGLVVLPATGIPRLSLLGLTWPASSTPAGSPTRPSLPTEPLSFVTSSLHKNFIAAGQERVWPVMQYIQETFFLPDLWGRLGSCIKWALSWHAPLPTLWWVHTHLACTCSKHVPCLLYKV